jgi:hypothetical protein
MTLLQRSDERRSAMTRSVEMRQMSVARMAEAKKKLEPVGTAKLAADRRAVGQRSAEARALYREAVSAQMAANQRLSIGAQ